MSADIAAQLFLLAFMHGSMFEQAKIAVSEIFSKFT